METLVYFQKGFNYSQDGPGNRLVYHLYGCDMRCPWCANPECFAADTVRHEVTCEEIVEEAVRSRMMFFDGGGVTFTGGEATLRFDALKTALTALKAAGIHTALESNAGHPRLPELFPLIDHLMLDLKHPDGAEQSRICGVGNETALQNIRAAAHRQIALRIPLIHGYNTSDACMEGFLKFLKELPENPSLTVELLTYHEYGRVKWEKHGMEYTVRDGFVPATRLNEIRERLHTAGIPLIRT